MTLLRPRTGRGRRWAAWVLAVAVAVLGVGTAQVARAGVGPSGTHITAEDWPQYGHDSQRSFVGQTTLNPLSVQALAPKWFFRTGDAVTAEPTVVAGTVYVGSWDGNFYALDANTGALRWKYALDQQPAVFPHTTGRSPADGLNDFSSDGGIVTSSATFVPGDGRHPDLLLVGGGFTLYALRAGDLGPDQSRLYWKHVYSGLPERSPDPQHDPTRIFASPAVVGDQVLAGVSTDGESGYRGYFFSADLLTGELRWRFETDVDRTGTILNDGCGGVWASPAIDETAKLAVFGISDCNNLASPPFGERLLALRLAPTLPAGVPRLAWVFSPPRLRAGDPPCDFDFGATANFGRLPNGTEFLGAGSKDGTYYALDPSHLAIDPTTGLPTPALRWASNEVFGGTAGGFIGPAAFDGRRVYASTAIGDFPPPTCEPGNLSDLPLQEPSVFGFDATGGKVLWTQPLAESFGGTTEAGGMTFAGTVLSQQVQIRDAASGVLLKTIPLPADSDSGVVVSGDSIYFGTGGPEQGTPDGVYAFAPAQHLLAP